MGGMWRRSHWTWIGMSIHEPPAVAKGVEPFKLQKNMVIAIETWYGPYGGDHGCRLEEECVVTDTGCEVYNQILEQHPT